MRQFYIQDEMVQNGIIGAGVKFGRFAWHRPTLDEITYLWN